MKRKVVENETNETNERDKDELRRLSCMVSVIGLVPEGMHELAGTLINGLVYHQHKGEYKRIKQMVVEAINDPVSLSWVNLHHMLDDEAAERFL